MKTTRTYILPILHSVYSSPLVASGPVVGGVYDDDSSLGNLPVILVVGINYGQTGTSGHMAGKCDDHVNYAPYIDKAFGGFFHTVLWNFFPFLLAKPWMEEVINTQDQVERVFTGGYADPMMVFDGLVAALDPDHIVFHGVTSIVPMLGRCAMARHPHRSAYLTHNLARHRADALKHRAKWP